MKAQRVPASILWKLDVGKHTGGQLRFVRYTVADSEHWTNSRHRRLWTRRESTSLLAVDVGQHYVGSERRQALHDVDRQRARSLAMSRSSTRAASRPSRHSERHGTRPVGHTKRRVDIAHARCSRSPACAPRTWQPGRGTWMPHGRSSRPSSERDRGEQVSSRGRMCRARARNCWLTRRDRPLSLETRLSRLEASPDALLKVIT